MTPDLALYIIYYINFLNDDDDDISKLQPKASLTFEFIKTSASTFNPTGSLSSTEDNVHKNKRSKLQKVKVKRQTGVQQSRLQFLASC